jgi:hypothetical protein
MSLSGWPYSLDPTTIRSGSRRTSHGGFDPDVWSGRADDVSILRFDAETLTRVAHCGWMKAPSGYVPVVRGTVAGRSVLERRPIHVADLQTETEAYPEGSKIARELGHRTIIVVPLLREGVPLGVISRPRRA